MAKNYDNNNNPKTIQKRHSQDTSMAGGGGDLAALVESAGSERRKEGKADGPAVAGQERRGAGWRVVSSQRRGH